MTVEYDVKAIEIELLAFHAAAQQSFRARDFAAYQECFTDDLDYVQPDGKQIGKQQLMRDVRKQLEQHKSIESESAVESIEINRDGTVTQNISQIASYSVSVFIFFTKRWKIERKGVHTYRMTDNGWRICGVEVLSETVNSIKRHSSLV